MEPRGRGGAPTAHTLMEGWQVATRTSPGTEWESPKGGSTKTGMDVDRARRGTPTTSTPAHLQISLLSTGCLRSGGNATGETEVDLRSFGPPLPVVLTGAVQQEHPGHRARRNHLAMAPPVTRQTQPLGSPPVVTCRAKGSVSPGQCRATRAATLRRRLRLGHEAVPKPPYVKLGGGVDGSRGEAGATLRALRSQPPGVR